MTPKNLRMRRVWGFLLLLLGSSLHSQAPEGWNARPALGAELSPGVSWVGGGVWAGDQSGPPATLIGSLGLGNSLTGGGVALEGGLQGEAWSLALKTLAFRDSDGGARLTLHQGHLSWKSRSGWKLGLEAEPLVWGYGLTGGYLLGEAARPFPRFRVQTPPAQLQLFGTPLGTWGFQWFTGRLENHRRLADNMQDASYRRRLIEDRGDPQSPLLTGYHVDGTFQDGKVECYANWTVLWAGTRQGRAMTSGYSFNEYLTAITGLKDPLVESSIDPATSDGRRGYRNGARSSSNFDLGLRFRIDPLARLVSADRASGYISRGTKGLTVAWGLLRRKPLYWLGKDLEKDGRNILRADFRDAWYGVDNHVVPNLIVPNDAFGLLMEWGTLRLGLERRSTSNPRHVSYRSFANDEYITGFYRDGDPLGEALGGEADTTTLRLEWDATSKLGGTFWFLRGVRPFRDDPSLWALDHPGERWTEDRFTGLQADVHWKIEPTRSFRFGCAWEGHSAAGYVLGHRGNGFRWFAELSARWLR